MDRRDVCVYGGGGGGGGGGGERGVTITDKKQYSLHLVNVGHPKVGEALEESLDIVSLRILLLLHVAVHLAGHNVLELLNHQVLQLKRKGEWGGEGA